MVQASTKAKSYKYFEIYLNHKILKLNFLFLGYNRLLRALWINAKLLMCQYFLIYLNHKNEYIFKMAN